MVPRFGDLSTSHCYLGSPDLISRLREKHKPTTKTSRSTERRSGDRMWVTLPFHPVWANHTAKAIRKFLNDDNWNAISSQGFEGHQNLIDKIRNAQDRVVQLPAATRVPDPEVVQVRQHEYRAGMRSICCFFPAQFVDSSLHSRSFFKILV